MTLLQKIHTSPSIQTPYAMHFDEVDDITTRMRESAQAISRLTRQLEEAVS